MKFRCERDTLVESLTIASRAVGSRGNLTASTSGVRIQLDGNRLSLVGTDFDLTARVEVEAIGLDDGTCVAPARLAVDIVRSLEPGAVTFEIADQELEISAARSRFVVRTYAVEDFPVLLEPRSDQMTLPGVLLAEALRQVVRAASNDDARPLLTGVLVAAEGDGVRIVATDSYRLALRDLSGLASLPEGVREILVPARALSELQRLLPTTKSPGRGKQREGVSSEDATKNAVRSVGLSIGDLDATFTLDNVRLTTRLLEGKFPDYRQLIPPAYSNQLRVGKEALMDALRRARLLVRDNTTPVRLSMQLGTVELTVVSQELGHASEDVDAVFEGDDLTIAFNPAYLMEGVEATEGDEVLLETVDATKPATVRSPQRDDFQYLLMPVRVS